MTNLQARAITKARRTFECARKELNKVKLSETRYRGVPYITDHSNATEIHGTFTYRGQTYVK